MSRRVVAGRDLTSSRGERGRGASREHRGKRGRGYDQRQPGQVGIEGGLGCGRIRAHRAIMPQSEAFCLGKLTLTISRRGLRPSMSRDETCPISQSQPLGFDRRWMAAFSKVFWHEHCTTPWLYECAPEIESEAGERRKAAAEARWARANVGHTDHFDTGHARCGRDGGRYLDLRLDLVADAGIRRCCCACGRFESPYFAIAGYSHCDRIRADQRDDRERGFHAHCRG